MKRNVIETVLGGVVLIIAGVFLVISYNSSDLRPVEGYKVMAKVNSIDGLVVGSDVRIAGVKVGSVIDQRIDPEDYRAVVTMTVIPSIKLPTDTLVRVSSNGLLGDKYIKLEPGGKETFIQPGKELADTKDVISLEELLGKVIFLVTEDNDPDEKN